MTLNSYWLKCVWKAVLNSSPSCIYKDLVKPRTEIQFGKLAGVSKLVHKLVKNGHKKLRFGSQGVQVSEVHVEAEGTVLFNQQNRGSKCI